MIAPYKPPAVGLAAMPHRVEVRAGPRHPWTLAAELPDRAAAVREVQARLRTHTCDCIRVRPAPAPAQKIKMTFDEVAVLLLARNGPVTVLAAAQRLGDPDIAGTRARATEAVARLVGAELFATGHNGYVLTARGREWAERRVNHIDGGDDEG